MKRYLFLLLAFALFTLPASAQTDPNAKINLTMVSLANQPVQVGDTFGVQIRMHAATTDQRYQVADIVFGWDNTKLEFLGVDHTGSHPYIWVGPSGLPCVEDENGEAIADPLCSGLRDFYLVNEAMPPADGNAIYFGYGELGQVFTVTNAEVNIVRLRFKAIDSFTSTEVFFIPELLANPLVAAKTIVYGGYIPGLSVTGTLTGAVVTGAVTVAGDLDGNGSVDSADMALLLSNWGASAFGENPYDLDGDGVVGAGDLAVLVNNWG
jgi:hypothetical protein